MEHLLAGAAGIDGLAGKRPFSARLLIGRPGYADQLPVTAGPVGTTETGVLQAHVRAYHDHHEGQGGADQGEVTLDHPTREAFSSRWRSLIMSRGSGSRG